MNRSSVRRALILLIFGLTGLTLNPSAFAQSEPAERPSMTRMILYSSLPELGRLEVKAGTIEAALMTIAALARQGDFREAEQRLKEVQARATDDRGKYLSRLFQLHLLDRQYDFLGGGQKLDGEAQLGQQKLVLRNEPIQREIQELSARFQGNESVDAFQAWKLKGFLRLCSDSSATIRGLEVQIDTEPKPNPFVELMKIFKNSCVDNTTEALAVAVEAGALNRNEQELLSHLVIGELDLAERDFVDARSHFTAGRDLALKMKQQSGAAEFMLGLGDLEAAPYGSAETLGFDLSSEKTVRFNLQNHLLVRSELMPRPEALKSAANWYQRAEAAFGLAGDKSGSYRVLMRRAYLAFRTNDKSARDLYRRAAERARLDGFPSGGALAGAHYALLVGDREAFAQAVSSVVERRDIGMALSLAELGASWAARAWFIYSNPQAAATSLRLVIDGLEQGNLNRTAEDLLFLLSEIYSSTGRSEASIEVIQEAIVEQRQYLKTVEDAERQIEDTLLTKPLMLRMERSGQVDNLFKLCLALINKVGEEQSPYWIDRRNAVEQEFLVLARKDNANNAREFEHGRDMISINQEVQNLLRRRDCTNTLDALKKARTRAITLIRPKNIDDEIYMLRLDNQLSTCDPQILQHLRESSQADPLELFKQALAHHKPNFDMENQQEFTRAQTYLAAKFDIAANTQEYGLLLSWLDELENILKKEAIFQGWLPWIKGNRAIALVGLKQPVQAREIVNQLLSDQTQWFLLSPTQRIFLLGVLLDAESLAGNAEGALFALERLRYERQKWQEGRSGVNPESKESAELAMLERQAAVVGESGSLPEDLKRIRQLRNEVSQSARTDSSPTLEEIKTTLARMSPSVTALIYHVGPHGIVLWKATTRQPLQMIQLRASVYETLAYVSDLERMLMNANPGWEVPAHELWERLIAPALPLENGATLVFILPKSLATIPFEVLGPTAQETLVQDHPIIYTSRLKRHGIFASSLPQGEKVSLVLGYNGQSLSRAEDEANKVADLLKTEPLLGERGATKERVFDRIKSARWIHLATDSVIDDTNPYLSYLSLAGGERIEAWQLFRDAPQAEMIVLSACDTKREAQSVNGIASDIDATSLNSFAFSGGAQWVIASLWQADDDRTTQLMSDFYRALTADKLNPAQALRKAKLNQIDIHPSYYGHLVLSARDLSSIR